MRTLTSNFASLIGAMLDFGRAHGRSERWMTDGASSFDRFCVERFPDEHCLTQEVALAFAQSDNEMSVAFRRQRVVFARRLAGYINSTGGDAFVIPERFVPEYVRYTPYILTDEELRRLFRAADDYAAPITSPHPFSAVLLPVLLRLTYACGLRPQEGRMIKVKDMDTRTGEIVLRETKGNSERVVVMAEDVAEMVFRYDLKRRAWFPESEFLFPGSSGGALSDDLMRRMFKRCWQTANKDTPPDNLPHLRVYDLRHRYASAILTKWLDEGKDINAMLPFLQSYMGHRNIESTAYYVHILPENITSARGIDWSALESLIPEVGV